jgi:hypothetical protein
MWPGGKVNLTQTTGHDIVSAQMEKTTDDGAATLKMQTVEL